MPQYVATVLINVIDFLDRKKSDKESVKGLLENRIFPGDINESVFRNGDVNLRFDEVKILVMKID